MADLRNKLKTASFKNQSLQDILKSCSVAIELISVESYTGGIHNTKMTLKLNRGDNYVSGTVLIPDSTIATVN